MKRIYILVCTVLLISLFVSGSTMAWFTHSTSISNEFNMGTVQVEVLDFSLDEISREKGTKYKAEIRVLSRGSKDTYVRLRLIPKWNNPSLPIPNVEVKLEGNSNWVKADDDYLYYSNLLTKGKISEPLIVSVIFKELDPKDIDQKFTLKVVAQGVQATREALAKGWGIRELPSISY